ncbi:MAG TPA: 3-hydroxyacyl-CoA dehydrogenase NAD-binding domain-containing protein [Geminicoccaceae bacterium]|nr:3-hydroxyacyl-CoA dehydrogenase NAD-binding domain-containing protein [Geminicoccaceae bacterium]
MPARPDPDEVRRIACIGAGVIGGGWAAHFVARGYEVVAWDPAPDAEAKLRDLVATAWPALEALGLAADASPDRLSFARSLEAAVAGAEFVQESAPERLDLKREILAVIDRAAPAEVVIASSTSGFAMTEMQPEAPGAARMVVGHPFNPPYLIPLVEVVGGMRTDPGAIAWAAAFYRTAGKYALQLERELPGFIANRLQDAMWREALHMVAAGEATVEQIDAAIREGPGLRWPIMGPCLTFHLAGGVGGMAHMLDHFGPALQEPWTRLEAPPLTQELRDRMVEGCEREAAGRTVAELVRERDAKLVAILKALAVQ